MKILENFLLKSPYLIRTVAANLVAWKQKDFKQAGNWEKYLTENTIRQYYEMSTDEIQKIQNQRLVTLVQHAREHVPFYKEYFANLPKLVSLDDLIGFPFMTKEQMRKAGAAIIDPELKKRIKFVKAHTSGSTGSPFTYYVPVEAFRMGFALRNNFYLYHRCNFDELNIRLGGRLFKDVASQTPPFWIRDYVYNQLLFSTWHMNEQNMETFFKPIEKYKPTFVTGYSSSVSLFAKFCQKREFHFAPKAVIIDSETLLDYQRIAIENAWNCGVFDMYGLESGAHVGKCKKGKYHVFSLTTVLEVVDKEEKPQKPGEIGELVGTDLTNSLMPFIRYRTGDMGIWSIEPCTCGWNTPTLETVVGRIDDFITLPDGRMVGRMDHVFKEASAIKECQIIQERPDFLKLLLVPDECYNETSQTALLNEIYKRLGNDITIEIQIVEQVPRGRNGKFRAVVSYVK